jgi:hypothetical protein
VAGSPHLQERISSLEKTDGGKVTVRDKLTQNNLSRLADSSPSERVIPCGVNSFERAVNSSCFLQITQRLALFLASLRVWAASDFASKVLMAIVVQSHAVQPIIESTKVALLGCYWVTFARRR